MKNAILVAALFAIAAVAGAPAQAKPLSKIIADTGLTPEDFSILDAKAQTLYDTPSPKPGKKVSWSNPESKSHGTVRLAAMRDNCAYIQHFVFPKGAETSREIRYRRCKAADGSWLFQP